MACVVLCILTLQSLPCKICPVLMRLVEKVEIIHSLATQKHMCMCNPI